MIFPPLYAGGKEKNATYNMIFLPHYIWAENSKRNLGRVILVWYPLLKVAYTQHDNLTAS